MTYHPPQQPGPPGPWGPDQNPQQQGSWDPQQPPQAYEYPAYDVPPQQYAPPQYGPPQYGYGAPPPGYPYPPYAPQPPKKSNGLWWILGGVTSVLIVAALVVGGVFLFRSGDEILVSTDETQIQELVEEFGAAGNTGKFSDLGQYFCAAEAGMFGALGELGDILEGMDVPQSTPSTEVTATDIEVKGDVASAKMNAGGPFDTAYFRKESGEWKVCMSAAVEFSQR
ncbi:MAG: Rv0361 family membrane protein [Mycobacterium sp.]